MYINVLFILKLLTCYLAHPNEADKGTLIIYSEGFTNETGNAVVFVYRKNDRIPDCPYRIKSSLIKNHKAEFSLQDLPFDEYAVILLHDENNNTRIDHTLGIPSEPLGYSNGWKLGLFSGMPSFSKLKFKFSPSDKTQTINITYKN